MPITTTQKTKVLQVVNVFETGTINGNYGGLTLFFDGPAGADGKPIKQITYGRSQTTEFGNLKTLLQQYIANNGLFANAINPFLGKMGKQPSLCTELVLLKALKDSGKLDPIMKTTQDSFFDQKYYQPAFNWFAGMKFTLPLSLLVIYDSHIQSGTIRPEIREMFSEKVPKNGGDEKTWIKQYVNARHTWLTKSPKPVVRQTIYRTQCFKNIIAKNNWDLSLPVNANGTIVP
jgi:chitosanase